MRPEDRHFQNLKDTDLWQRYCGFLDLSVEEFLDIQEELLMDEIDRVAGSTLGKKIMKGRTPKNLEEFQRVVPFTTYEDYEPYLSERNEESLSEKPHRWCHSSGRGGKQKWIPQTDQCYEKAIRNFIGSCILASAEKKGEINIGTGFNLLATLPPVPYTSGTVYDELIERFSFQPIPPPDLVKDLEFPQKLQKGFEMALRLGVDILGSISSVLVRMGQEFAGQARKRKFSASMLHPAVVTRMLKGLMHSKREKRALLPKDLWSPKGIVAGGMDTFIYKSDIARYWGKEPFDFYVSTETLFVAMQAWNQKAMTFIPDSVFFEFAPLDKEADRRKDQRLLLLDELQEDQLYEVVVTQFHGMPLLRYRIGDIIRVQAREDTETGVKLPQIMIQRKVGETIDLAGLATLDEKTVWQAIANTGVEYSDWTACKEYEQNQTHLRIYLEPREECEAADLEVQIHQQLERIDEDYRDIGDYLKKQPVKVTLLAPGTFQSYMDEKRRQGADLAHLKPKHINPSPQDIQRLHIWSGAVRQEITIP